MPGGHVSEYTPELGAEILRLMAEGYSVTAAAGAVGFSRQTVYKWAHRHPEFGDALNKGRALAAKWWEDRAHDLAKKGDGNAAMIIFALKNRVSDEWREKQEVEHSGGVGVQITVVDGFASDDPE